MEIDPYLLKRSRSTALRSNSLTVKPYRIEPAQIAREDHKGKAELLLRLRVIQPFSTLENACDASGLGGCVTLLDARLPVRLNRLSA